jgi:hypothetical protein
VLAVVDGRIVRGRIIAGKFQTKPEPTDADDARERMRDASNQVRNGGA